LYLPQESKNFTLKKASKTSRKDVELAAKQERTVENPQQKRENFSQLHVLTVAKKRSSPSNRQMIDPFTAANVLTQ
jgi:hypothetical protein